MSVGALNVALLLVALMRVMVCPTGSHKYEAIEPSSEAIAFKSTTVCSSAGLGLSVAVTLGLELVLIVTFAGCNELEPSASVTVNVIRIQLIR